MEASIIQIGNSKGIRIPKTLLKKYQITGSVELILEKDCIVLRPKHSPRKGWAQAFKKMHQYGDDEQLLPDVFEDESIEE